MIIRSIDAHLVGMSIYGALSAYGRAAYPAVPYLSAAGGNRDRARTTAARSRGGPES